MSRNNPASRFASSSRFSQLSFYNGGSPLRPFYRSAVLNTSTNSSSAFDVYWSKLWDQIVPYGETGQRPSTSDSAALSELKTFTGRLIESVIAKLKAAYSQSTTKARLTASAPCTVASVSLHEQDVEALCRDIMRKLTRGKSVGGISTANFSSTFDGEPTVVEPSERCDDDNASDVEAETDGDDRADADDLLFDDACLRQFAGGVVKGLYAAMRRRLRDTERRCNDEEGDSRNCSHVVANADNDIRSHVPSFRSEHFVTLHRVAQ